MSNNDRIGVGTERNLDIAVQEMIAKPDDPRSYWLAANASTMAGKKEEAKNLYLEFIQLSHSKEEQYLAWSFLADIYADFGMYEQAVKCVHEMLQIHVEYPQTWHKYADVMFKQGKYRHAVEFTKTGLEKKLNEKNVIVHNPLDFTYNPWILLAKASVELYDDETALKYFKKCYEMRPLKSIEVIISGLEKGLLPKIVEKNTDL